MFDAAAAIGGGLVGRHQGNPGCRGSPRADGGLFRAGLGAEISALRAFRRRDLFTNLTMAGCWMHRSYFLRSISTIRRYGTGGLFRLRARISFSYGIRLDLSGMPGFRNFGGGGFLKSVPNLFPKGNRNSKLTDGQQPYKNVRYVLNISGKEGWSGREDSNSPPNCSSNAAYVRRCRVNSGPRTISRRFRTPPNCRKRVRTSIGYYTRTTHGRHFYSSKGKG